MHKISRSDLEKLSNFADVIIRHLLLTLTKSDNKTLKIMAEKKTTKTATKTAAAKKTVKKAAPKKLGKIIFEFDGKQIDYKAIEKKAAKLGGNVYVVAAEGKIFDAEGKSVDLF